MRKTLPERFWSKVKKRGPRECWPWTGAQVRGRGYLRVHARMVSAARLMLAITYGFDVNAIPIDYFVCPTCANPN